MFAIGLALGVEFRGRNLILLNVKKGIREFSLLEHGVIEDFRDLSPAELQSAVRGFLKSNGSSRERVILGIPREQAVVRWIELPLDVEENLEQVVRFQVERFEPTDEEQSYVDHVVLGRDEQKKKLLLQVTLVPRIILDDYLHVLRQADLYPAAVRLASLAYHQVFLAHADGFPKKLPCLVLALNPGSLEMLFINDSSKFFSHKIVLEGVEELGILKIRQYVDAFLSHVDPLGQDLSKLYLTGLLAQRYLEDFQSLSGDCELLRRKLQLTGKDLSGEALEDWIAVAGLAISGISNQAIARSNLIPPDKRIIRDKPNLVPTFVLVGLLFVIAVAMVARGYIQQSRFLGQIETQITLLQPRVDGVMKLREQVQQQEKSLEEIRDLMMGRQRVLSVLKELTEKIPDNTFLQNLSLQGERVNMMGYSSSASALLPILLDSEYLEGVESRYITPDRSMGNREKFNFEATVKQRGQ